MQNSLIQQVIVALVASSIFSVIAITTILNNLENPKGYDSEAFTSWSVFSEANKAARLAISKDVLESHGIPVTEESLSKAGAMFEREHEFLFTVWMISKKAYHSFIAYAEHKDAPITERMLLKTEESSEFAEFTAQYLYPRRENGA